ncbi:hypothetical protein E4U55_007671 [Claviceps digitariae]|nr:hypothetical protein E4U55_007671 [Claviceps digitariae]
MEDPDDVILYLVPHQGFGHSGAVDATSAPQNASRLYRTPRVDNSGQVVTYEPGGKNNATSSEDWDLIDHVPCLVLRFSDGARTEVGVVCGTALYSDVKLRKFGCISLYHLAFTFDSQNRPIVRDLASRSGTMVTYDGEMGECRSNFEWLLEGPSICRGKAPILHITKLIQFKVLLPYHDITCPNYVNKVQRWRANTADPYQRLAALILQNVTETRLPSGEDTPLQGSEEHPIVFTRVLGSGAFGEVTYAWNNTTGDEYVVKRPRTKHITNGDFNPRLWHKEATLMSSISHPHIVAFRSATLSLIPELQFEYISGGSLEMHDRLSPGEITQVLCQLSSALDYLHRQQPPIVHRDIKPENILVAKRQNGLIHVKFGDFGLSKPRTS